MSKEIRKNREGLIRHFYSVNHIPRVSISDCAKCRAIKCFGINPYVVSFGGEKADVPSFVSEELEMTDTQWHNMESYFEGWTHIFEGAGHGKKTFSQVADWLQTLPGWPRVL